MSLRCVIFSLLLMPLVFAADQPPVKADSSSQSAKIAKPDDSTSPPNTDSHRSRPHIRFGGFTFGAGYSHFSGGYPYGYGPDYWCYSADDRYSPLLWPAFYHPGYYTGFAYQPMMGNVKIQAPDKTSVVYLDGGIAGSLDKLKNMWLEPGAYLLEVRNSNRRFTQKIYVLSGKTLKVTTETMASEALQ